MRGEYRTALRTAVASSAAPYGYTLTIWTSGAVISHEVGLPASWEALLFMGGAVAGFALVGGLAFGGFHQRFAPEPKRAALWSSFHVLPIALAIGAATVTSILIPETGAWPLGGFLSTTIYLVVLALQLVAGGEGPASLPDGDT